MTQHGADGAGRATAIVLFTDVVGSTETRTRLGEDAADEIRHRHDALIFRAVEAGGGTVVKNLGDGFMATFVGAAAALRAAVAIQQGIDHHNRSRPLAPLAVRVGISGGDVAFEGGDCFGTPVIEAARLCAAARGGQILASETVRWLARSGEAAFTAVGNLELKGLPEPVPAVEVGWDPLPQSDVPLPTFLTDIGRIFVGRDGELRQLEQRWKEAVSGELRVVLLAGEPGVGKTRLAAQFARSVHDEGALVLAGRCDEDLGVPYQPFVEALRHYADHCPALAERMGRYGGELARLVPEVTGRVPDLGPPLRSDPDTERYRLFDAVAAWLAAASVDEPLLLVLDDLQWAAKPTLFLLRHIVRAAGGRVLILGTYRDTELAHDHPLVEVVAELRRQSGVDRLSLGGLDDLGVAAIVEQAAGRTLDEAGLALARAVYEETEGNPFFVREVLRHLAETGAIERQEGGWAARLPVDQMGIPEGVRDVVGRRLARLRDATNQVLRVASVVGPEFELGVVKTAADLSEESLLSAVEEAIAARIVVEVSAGRCRFAHALVRATLYDAISTARQAALHRKAGEAIESIHRDNIDDHVSSLAHHWAKASASVDTVKAVEYARRAGNRAAAQLAHDEAARYYGSALDLLDVGGADLSDPRRVEVVIALGEAQRRAGDSAYRQTLLDAAHLARRLGDARALARAALGNTLGHMWTTAFVVDAARVETLEAAISAVGEDDPGLRSRLLATLGLELAWQPDASRRLALSAEALRIARALGDLRTLAEVLLARDYTVNAPDNAVERLEATTELLAAADELGDPVLASRALSLRFKVALEMADVGEAERSLATNRVLVADLGQPVLTWTVLHHAATLLILRGDEEAPAAAAAAREFGTGIGQQEIFFKAHELSLAAERDRLGELELWVRVAAERSQSPFVKALHATILARSGETDEAARLFDEFAGRGFTHPANTVAWLCFMTCCAWLAHHLDRPDAVPPLRTTLQRYPDQLVVGGFAGWVPGSVAFYLALLCTTSADWTAGDAYFAGAAALEDRAGAPVLLARTRLEWARMLLARSGPGDTERAGELLDRVLITARQLRLTQLEREGLELLSVP